MSPPAVSEMSPSAVVMSPLNVTSSSSTTVSSPALVKTSASNVVAAVFAWMLVSAARSTSAPPIVPMPLIVLSSAVTRTFPPVLVASPVTTTASPVKVSRPVLITSSTPIVSVPASASTSSAAPVVAVKVTASVSSMSTAPVTALRAIESTSVSRLVIVVAASITRAPAVISIASFVSSSAIEPPTVSVTSPLPAAISSMIRLFASSMSTEALVVLASTKVVTVVSVSMPPGAVIEASLAVMFVRNAFASVNAPASSTR